MKSLSYLFFLLISNHLFAQHTVIKGKISDATTGEAIPFANVFFMQSHFGTTTDFDGFFTLTSNTPDDSVSIVVLGYKSRNKEVKKGTAQTLNVQLDPEGFETKTIVVTPGENPAFRILRGVWANKEKNDKRNLDSYQYESYSKVEVDADNINKKFTGSSVFAPFKNIFDSLKLAAGEDGKPILPFYISETLSDYYFLKVPERKKEVIKGNRSQGVGVGNQSSGFVAQIMGSSFQDYNFYQNYINLLEKNFISPIATGGRDFYKYYLVDSLVIDGKYCYKIDFKPKRKQDLAFTGSIWITDTTFALRRIVVEVGTDANLNYVERIKIQQELEQTSSGHWIPAKVRILLDIKELNKNAFGLLAKFYVSNKNFMVNKPKELTFYEERVVTEAESQNHDTAYWNANRHEKLTAQDKVVYSMIDSVKDLPTVRTYVDLIQVISSGYVGMGKYVDFGNLYYCVGYNNVEGARVRAGLKTTYAFSKYWMLEAYTAYGFKDNQFKYNFEVARFLSRKTWTKVGVQYKKDVEGFGLQDDFFGSRGLLNAVAQLGLINRLNRFEQSRVWMETDLTRGLTQRVFFLSKHIEPLGINFGFYPNPEKKDKIEKSFSISEITLETRFAYKDIFILAGNKRLRLTEERFPIFMFQYTYGIKGLFGSDFEYHKASINVSQLMKLGAFGRGEYSVTARKVFATLPYPLLDIQLGNETPLRGYDAFNLMRFFEFIGDQSLTASYTQHFDGLFFNRVPVLRKAKLREVVGAKTAWVGLTEANKRIIPPFDNNGKPILQPPNSNPNIPYVEVFYGVENLFNFIRIDAIHRLTYIDPPNDKFYQRFAIKASLYFAF
ncbi:MAG: DUF5686 family protein [Bacteroidetes bacterium]|nr:DUF5686 family protein [Bacteroidota bacterium]